MKQQFIIKHGEYQAGRTVEFDNAELVSITMRKNTLKDALEHCEENATVSKDVLRDVVYLLENITGPSANYICNSPFKRPGWSEVKDKKVEEEERAEDQQVAEAETASGM